MSATSCGLNAANYSNSTAIGAGATITASNQIMLGTITEKVYIPGGSIYSPNATIYTGDYGTASIGGISVPSYGLSWQFDNSFNSTAPTGFFNSYGGLRFLTSSTPRMNITAAGKVGIGKTNPSCALDVSGSLVLKNTQPITGIVTAQVAGGSATGTVSFGYTFTTPPIVTATIVSNSNAAVFSVLINTVTTTGFSYSKAFVYANPVATGGGATSEPFNYIAIGT